MNEPRTVWSKPSTASWPSLGLQWNQESGQRARLILPKIRKLRNQPRKSQVTLWLLRRISGRSAWRRLLVCILKPRWLSPYRIHNALRTLSPAVLLNLGVVIPMIHHHLQILRHCPMVQQLQLGIHTLTPQHQVLRLALQLLLLSWKIHHRLLTQSRFWMIHFLFLK